MAARCIFPVSYSRAEMRSGTGSYRAVSSRTHDGFISFHFPLYPGYGGGGEFVALGGVGVYGGGRRSVGYISYS